MDALENYRQVTAIAQQMVDGCSESQMGGPTPCAKWQVSDLVNHMVGGNMMFAASRRGEEMAEPAGEMPDMLGGDAAGAYAQSVSAIVDAFGAEGALESPMMSPFGEVPGSMLLSVVAADQLTHAWDLARATGQSIDVPDEMASAAQALWAQVIPAEARGTDAFDVEKDAPEGASAIDRLAAFTGRDLA